MNVFNYASYYIADAKKQFTSSIIRLVFVGSSDTVDIEMLGYLSDPMPDAYYFVIFLC